MNKGLLVNRAILVIIFLLIFIAIGIYIQNKGTICYKTLDASPVYYAKCNLLTIVGGYIASPFLIFSNFKSLSFGLENPSFKNTIYIIFFALIEFIIAICISFLIFKKK
jgi:hypothetical protein